MVGKTQESVTGASAKGDKMTQAAKRKPEMRQSGLQRKPLGTAIHIP